MPLTESDIRLCVDAIWDNSIDARRAAALYDSDFDRAEAELKDSFVTFLAECKC
jgi:hypothetical protein